MVIKITGEQPFQVLSTTFTIGPSANGYDLYFSADGVNYTQLFTVSAGVNRQVTQVAAGSYYKLVGNTGNVTVNWYGNCVVDSGSGGGGGSTYVLPVASQNILGGIKVGSGLTIDANGVLSSNGGGGSEEQNYVITDDLELVEQVEGKMAYVPEHVTAELTGTRIYIDDFESFTEQTGGRAEGYLAMIHYADWVEGVDGPEDKVVHPVYISGNHFYWDWDNNEDLNTGEAERDGNVYTYKYRVFNGEDGNGSEAHFDFFDINNEGFIVSLSNYVGSEEVTEEETEPGQKYVSNGEDWVKINDFHYLYIGLHDDPEATVEDRVNLYNTIEANPNDDYSLGIVFDGLLRRFRYLDRNENGYAFIAMIGMRRVGFRLDPNGDVVYVYDDTPNIPGQHYINIDTGGTVQNNDSLYILSQEQPYHVWVRCDYDSEDYPGENTDTAYAPLKWAYRKYENINDEKKLVYYLAADVNINGTVYSGTWHFKEYEAGDVPLAADTWVAQQ